MKNIKVILLQDPKENPIAMSAVAAKLTQQSHNIKTMDDFMDLYNGSMKSDKLVSAIQKMQHHVVTRHSNWTILIFGASRRFLAQITRHHIGFGMTSGSLQYSDYSDGADFVVPFEVLEKGKSEINIFNNKCKNDLEWYKTMVDKGYDHDTAGYLMNQALRNILIITGNTEAWRSLIQKRSCNRNTPETQYIALRIWETLIENSPEMFSNCGPWCCTGNCIEGKMTCGKPFKCDTKEEISNFIKNKWGV